MSIYNDSVDIKIINDKDLLILFKELSIDNQKRIVNAGIRKAAKPIIDTAKVNFNATKKGKSLTGYADLNSSFKIEASKNPSVIGVKVGVKYNDTKGRKNWYKYRFIEYGTKDRKYVVRKRSLFNDKIGSIKKTGKMTATNFFYDAVEARKDQVQEDINKYIVEALEKTVKKYSK